MNRLITLLILSLALLGGASDAPKTTSFRSNFDCLDGWVDDSAADSPHSYVLEDGRLRISTRPQTNDRVKIRTVERFGPGRYVWRVFVPEMGPGEQASIGAFLYQDDRHELDFEIGSGTAVLREKLKADQDDLVCYCTCQAFPYSSTQTLLPANAWHTLTLDLALGKKGHYLATWFVNDQQVKQLQTRFGSETTFTAHCSLENLAFMGDRLPTREHYALFDYFEAKP